MIPRITGQFPVWARRDHPVLRQELGATTARPRWQVRYGRALGAVMIAGLLLLIGVLAATELFSRPAGQSVVEGLNAILYIPLLAAQIILRIVAFALTAGVVGEQRRRNTWDNLRATESGAELTLRARWASVFYRVRGLLIVVVLLRVVLIGGILYDLTAFQGRHLDFFLVGITPEVPLVIAVLLVAFLMTASILLPLTGAGFDASFGLFVSSVVEQRTLSTLIQAAFIGVRIALTVGLVIAAGAFLNGDLPVPVGADWLLMFASGAVGDWGLLFLSLTRFGEIWATVPYGVFLGLALLIFALLQAVLADALLVYAARRAQRRG